MTPREYGPPYLSDLSDLPRFQHPNDITNLPQVTEQANECPSFDITPKQLEQAVEAIYGALRKH